MAARLTKGNYFGDDIAETQQGIENLRLSASICVPMILSCLIVCMYYGKIQQSPNAADP